MRAMFLPARLFRPSAGVLRALEISRQVEQVEQVAIGVMDQAEQAAVAVVERHGGSSFVDVIRCRAGSRRIGQVMHRPPPRPRPNSLA